MRECFLSTSEYLDHVLLKYSSDFNIYVPYKVGEKQFSAYGYFASHNEKYVLVKEVNMWASDSFEHILFMEADKITEESIYDLTKFIREEMELNFVRNGKKYPSQNHMQSVLTVIMLVQQEWTEDITRLIKNFRFDKSYCFGFRGYSRGRIAMIAMDTRKIVVSSQAKDMKKVLKSVFDDIEHGKMGFRDVCVQQGIKHFQQ